MGKVTESIYSGSAIIPLADVSHIETRPKNTIPGIFVITKHTKYNFDHDEWENAIWISDPEAVQFKAAWCRYRSELEAETLADLSPGAACGYCARGNKAIKGWHELEYIQGHSAHSVWCCQAQAEAA